MSQFRFSWLLLILLLACTPTLAARALVRVDESKTQLQIGASESRLTLAVTGLPARGTSVRIDLEILDPKDHVIKALSHESILTAGSNLLEIPLDRFFSELNKSEQADFLWYRLRYRLKPSNPASEFEVVEGVLSVSEISPQPFQLKVGLPQYGVEGTRCRIHVLTSHPASGRSVKGVAVTGTLTIQDETGKRILTSAGLTNSSGYVGLDFELPRNLEDPDATVSVKAQLGGVVKKLSEDLEFQDRAQVLLSTDKPLYQPGQALRVRVLAFDASRRALAGSSLTLRIKDPEFTQVYRSELTTSRFGEANVEWSIPENARLGDYFVEVDRQHSSRIWAQPIKISRYELPNFTLSVKPDRPYYLAGQNAEVAVRADYLFGQPLKRGHVKVVRETERHWNYREQKYDTEEGQTVEGELDAEGRFVAKIDLESEHSQLADNDYQRYIDLRFAAYATDPTTNRTEQRRFDLRVTKDPIHVYVTKDHSNSEAFPLEFYLSTFYADGTPAKCDVAVRELPADAGRHSGSGAVKQSSQLLRIVKTNRYGVAKINGLRTTAGWQTDGDDPLLLFIANDGKGGRGEQTESFWGNDTPAIRIHTNKTLYRASEPLEVEIESSLKNGKVVLDIAREDRILHSRVVRLRKGKAFVVIPYVPEFKDELTLAAYSADNLSDDYSPPYGVRRVLYPRNRELKVDLRFGQTTYEPGQDATTTVRIRTAEGIAKESLLGVVVLDKAVEERARTDIEFGSAYGFYWAWAHLLGFDRELSGLTRRDLDRLDLNQPVPESLELAADALLNSWPDYYPHRLSQEDPTGHSQETFKSLIETQLAPLKKTLENRYTKDGEYPRDETSLRNMISDSSLNLDHVKDPWNARYRVVFSTDRSLDIVEMISAGPDKQFDSTDDIRALRLSWPYFRPHGENINRLVESYHQRTGGFVRDLATLKAELLKMGDRFDSWRDRWGQPYQVDFGILTTHFTITIRSSGPNRTFEALDVKRADDFPLWTASLPYTEEARIEVDQALNRYFKAGRGFPKNSSQFGEALSLSKVRAQNLQDPWGHPYYPTFKTEYHYSDRPTIVTYSDHLRASKQHTSTVPVTRQVQFLVLRSAGPDGTEGTSDDFDVATFSRLLTEQSSRESSPQLVVTTPILQGFTGAVTGVISDQTGAVVPGATVKASDSSASRVFEGKSDESGRYLLRNLPPGAYDVRFEMAGFKPTVIRHVPVQSSAATQLNVTLNVGQISETVTVSAGPDTLLQTESTAVAQVRESFSMKQPVQSSTPRLREYFPETLVWQPSLETDRGGRAQLKFKLADNITTWKMAVVASTEDGLIGMAEKEILSFQPFFLEHDPPQVLTEGDEIGLPVVLRNYTNKDQSVVLSMKPDSWFTSLDSTSKKASIKAGEAGREIFGFKAVASVKEGKQRVTALGSKASDAIEKPVTVHPDGEEVVQSVIQVFKELSRLDLTIPAEAIPNTLHAELKIYPNLMAHVVEGVEGILQRPYGCGEQTISSSYPSLMLLRFYKQSGAESRPLAPKAQRYLQTGYERLLGYRTEDGGFSYWGRGTADVALTAYALRFLHDADGLLAVDGSVLKGAYEWLVRQQQADGSWVFRNWQGQNDRQRSLNLTTLAARVLSMPGLRDAAVAGSSRLKPPQQRDPVRLALQFLQARIEESDEPYAVASLALAALNLGDKEAAESALKRLEAMVKREGDGAYWHLQANTPFYSWGLPGRLETTALAVRALALVREGQLGSRTSTSEQVSSSRESLIRQALLFLLRNKDRYGVWYSSQATVNVLDALMSLLGSEDGNSIRSGLAEIFVNGMQAGSLSLSNSAQAENPITVDVSKFLVTGGNRIEIRRSAGSSEATVQVLESHYVPWAHSTAATPKIDADSASALRLAVRFDKTEAKVSEDITCHVEVERIGFRGYGMLLGEIGLPPGADVDRASLDEAVKSAGSDLYRYDVLPDRLVVYLWPRAGGTKFEFKFRQRYGLKAQTAASVVYDYHNPEARTVVKPSKFAVRE